MNKAPSHKERENYQLSFSPIMSVTVTQGLDMLNVYGSVILVTLCGFMVAYLLRRMMRLPARADLYVALFAFICGNLSYLEPYAQRLVRRTTRLVQPNYYEDRFMKLPRGGP